LFVFHLFISLLLLLSLGLSFYTMKSASILAFSGMAAAMYVQPIKTAARDGSQSLLQARGQNDTVPEGNLLPWMPVRLTSPKCAHGASEKFCGTKAFCSLYADDLKPDNKYWSARNCFEHHEPDPSPGEHNEYLKQDEPSPRKWKKPSGIEGRCGWDWGYSDGICGTKIYCDSYGIAARPDGRYQNATRCLADHEPNPEASDGAATRRPWRVISPYLKDRCIGKTYPDARCGTDKYCDSYDEASKPDERYPSAQTCRDDHEPKPAGSDAEEEPVQPAPEKKDLKPWLEPGDRRACYGGDLSEKSCGTQVYCGLFGTILNRNQEYGSPGKCFRDHEPNPDSENAWVDTEE
jgi:hypothetical protein